MHPSFKMPTKGTIKGRSSTITNSFINAIISVVDPSDEEVEEVLRILGMDKTGPVCAYCGDKYTQWDHFRPLVVDKEHTGYISEIANLVPCCSTCNSSKGNTNWEEWMRSNAKKSPKTRKIKDLEVRVKRLKKFDEWSKPTKIILSDIIEKNKSEEYWNKYQEIMELFNEAQEMADEISIEVVNHSSKYEKVEVENMNLEKIQSDISEEKDDVLDRLLKSVGMKVFVEYYHDLLDLSIPNKVLVERLPYEYTDNSKATRVSKGRKIIREGLAKKALLKIASSSNVDPEVQKEANILLNDY